MALRGEQVALPAPEESGREVLRSEPLREEAVIITDHLIGAPAWVGAAALGVLSRDDDEAKAVLSILLMERAPLGHRLHTRLAPRGVELDDQQLHARSSQPGLYV